MMMGLNVLLVPNMECLTQISSKHRLILQVILLSDGSVTRHLKLMTGLDVKVVSCLVLHSLLHMLHRYLESLCLLRHCNAN